MTIEIVSFPMNSMVIFHSYVKLPEGNRSLVGGFSHLEKYEFVNGKDDISYIMENKKCVKPPTSSISFHSS